jgi:hypothetical protein
MNKVLYAPTTVSKSECTEALKQNILGRVEYHLHKDNTWIAEDFKDAESKNEILLRLKANEYKFDKVTYYEIELHFINNPMLSVEDKIDYKLKYLTTFN